MTASSKALLSLANDEDSECDDSDRSHDAQRKGSGMIIPGAGVSTTADTSASISLRSMLPNTEATDGRKKKTEMGSSRTAKRLKTTDSSGAVQRAKASAAVFTASTRGDALLEDCARFQAKDFQNIQHICRNAGSSETTLQVFLESSLGAKSVAIAVLWCDLTSSHVATTHKFCTPSSRCSHWYCTCDKHIRAEYTSVDRVMGIVVYITSDASKSGEPSREESAQMCYFLPLMRCFESTSSSLGPAAGNRQILPLKCATSLGQRKRALQRLLREPSLCKIVFHTQLSALALSGFTTTSVHPDITNIFDPRVAHYLLHPNTDQLADLDLQRLLHVYQISLTSQQGDNLHGLGKIASAVSQIKTELVGVSRLYHLLHDQLTRQSLLTVFQSIEMPLAFQLGALENFGVTLDLQRVNTMKGVIRQQLQSVSQKIYQLSGLPESAQQTLNIASPEQISRLLFEHLQLIPPQSSATTSSGKFTSTSEDNLRRISAQHPIVDWILAFRTLSKLLGTYIDGLEPFISSSRSKLLQSATTASFVEIDNTSLRSIHASWNQQVVRTGRLSCSKPNLQNIPSNLTLPQLSQGTEQSFSIRSFFVARPGYTLIAADYSQIEMRILAHVSGDKDMCDLFHQEQGDIYRLLASKIFQKPVEDVQDDERTRAKVICLGCIYGMGPVAAAAKLGIDVSTVSRITSAFFRHFSGVRQWIQRTKQQAKQEGEVRTLSGRRRLLPDMRSDDAALQAAAGRQAVNTVIQGTASDLIKSAMLLVSSAVAGWEDQQVPLQQSSDDETAEESRARTRLIMQIHDELILEVPMHYGDEFAQQLICLVRKVMEQDLVRLWRLSLPLLTTIKIGNDWGSMVAWTPPS